MCGICGIIRKDGQLVEKQQIVKMCSTIVHRGPDDEGIFISGSIGFGIRRLKIIDLDTGHQPIHNEDESIWVVLNGEIYNFQELRESLEKNGHRFYTRSDTEVIVHLYEDYGDKALEYLNGMFGIALWDARKKRLLLARDRLGIKQLYYYENDKYLIFGSEIKALLDNKDINRDIDYEALSDYFSLQYVPCPHTIYASIKKLPPACNLSISSGEKKTRIEKYWKLEYKPPYLTGKDAIDAIDSELQKAVKYQMISDVPLGAYLSGGTDSSLLVAMMANASQLPVETFSIIWGRESQVFDEREYARFVSDQYHTNHHEFLVEPNFEEVADNIIQGFDEPFADESAIPNYYIARETRKHVTVALSGLGGDEMSAGYERYLGIKLLHYYKILPDRARASISKALHLLPDPDSGWPWIERLKRFVTLTDYPIEDCYFNISSKINQSDKQSLFTPETLERIGLEYTPARYFREYVNECNTPDELNKMLYIDMNTYMVDQLLVLSDRMSMAHSLELRVPYLDHNLVEKFASIDPFMKLRFFEKKYLLKKVAERYFPKRFIYRKKMGFSSPIVIWLRNDLEKYMLSLLNRKSIEKTGILNPYVVERFISEHRTRRHNHDMKLWTIMMFMLWYDTYYSKIY